MKSRRRLLYGGSDPAALHLSRIETKEWSCVPLPSRVVALKVSDGDERIFLATRDGGAWAVDFA